MIKLSTYMHFARSLFLITTVFVLLVVPVVGVMAAKGDLDDAVMMAGMKAHAPLSVTLGKAELIDVNGSVADVLVADPSLIDVMAIQSNRLYVVGLAVGDTNIIVLDDAGDIVKRLDIHVSYDLQAIQALVEELFPEEHVAVRSIHDQILLTGKVSSAERSSKIANVVAHYVSDLTDDTGTVDELISNLLEVRGEQQVMLQVKIVEASRNVLSELGLETSFNSPVVSTFNRNGTDSLSLVGAVGLSEDPVASLAGAFDPNALGIGPIDVLLEALEQESLANILAEPNLTAVSGEQAGFLAGGEFPVPVGRDQTGNIVIEFREFGVSLNFRPVVLSADRISLQMNTEVSSLDFENAIVLADLTVPGLDVRRADTTVEIPSGNSLVIAGLLQSEAVKGMSGLPGISKTPVLGDLVSSDSFQRSETELVVIVTPFLVEAYKEVDKAEQIPKQKNNPLANSFAMNIRRTYEIEDQEIFDGNNAFGYLLD